MPSNHREAEAAQKQFERAERFRRLRAAPPAPPPQSNSGHLAEPFDVDAAHRRVRELLEALRQCDAHVESLKQNVCEGERVVDILGLLERQLLAVDDRMSRHSRRAAHFALLAWESSADTADVLAPLAAAEAQEGACEHHSMVARIHEDSAHCWWPRKVESSGWNYTSECEWCRIDTQMTEFARRIGMIGLTWQQAREQLAQSKSQLHSAQRRAGTARQMLDARGSGLKETLRQIELEQSSRRLDCRQMTLPIDGVRADATAYTVPAGDLSLTAAPHWEAQH
jgi:hypothetical protein